MQKARELQKIVTEMFEVLFKHGMPNTQPPLILSGTDSVWCKTTLIRSFEGGAGTGPPLSVLRLAPFDFV